MIVLKQRLAVLSLALAGLCQVAVVSRADDWNTVDPGYRHASPEAVERWRDMKYGLRICWGQYSLWNIEASWPVQKMPDARKQEYFNLYRKFNPTDFDAEKWMDLLERGGLKFFTILTKHHDGFSMFDTKTRVKRRLNWVAPGGPAIEDCDLAYSIMESPFKRDVIKELCDAAHKRDIGIDLYFSHLDWYDADFRMDEWNPRRDKNYTPQTDPEGYARFVRRHREQIREILTKYGKVDKMCLDEELPKFCWPDVKETILMARRLQPDCLFRNRGIGAYGDYHTPENWIPDSPRSSESKLPWMVIYTLAQLYTYDPDAANYKPGSWIVSNLMDIVAKGGNFMVILGPDGKGNFHPQAIKSLGYAGDWLKVNGEAIYKTRPWTQWKEGSDIRFTRSKDGKYIYALSLKWPGKTFRLRSVRPREGSAINLLGSSKPLSWQWDAARGLAIDLPEELQDEANRPCKQAYAFKIEGQPAAVDAAVGEVKPVPAPTGVMTYLADRAARMAESLPALPRDRGAWEARRKVVRQELPRLLGLPPREPMRAKVLATREDEGLIVEDVAYLWAGRAYVSANVVRPKQTAGRLPALVVPPGYFGELSYEYYKTFVCHMARKGFVLLFIDDPHVGKRSAPCAGLYATAAAAGTQVMGIQVFDTLRGLDYLLTRKDVDPGRIGVAGLCQGSEQTWLAAALEDRFKLAVPVCGTTTYEGWARMPWECGVDLSDPSPYVAGVLRKTDWHEIGACIAPRPVYIASNSGDNWWPIDGYDKVVDTLQATFALYGQPQRFKHLRDFRSHSMTPFIPELAPWIESQFAKLPTGSATPQACGDAVNPDFSMLRHMQRKIASQAAALPGSFTDGRQWDDYRRKAVDCLRAACDLDGLKLGPSQSLSCQSSHGIVTEVVSVPQDQGLAVPVTLVASEGAEPGAAVILSLDSGQSAADKDVVDFARKLAGDGYLVAVPEHASSKTANRRFISNISSLYGAADTVGLPPLAMRVWDDLAAVHCLAGWPEGKRLPPSVLGLGLGGVDAAITAALDERIAAVAAIEATTVQQWSASTAPQLGPFDRIMPYLPDIAATTDWQYIYAAACPRPLLLVDRTDRASWPEATRIRGLTDQFGRPAFRVESAAFAQVRETADKVYRLHDATNRLTVVSATSRGGLEEFRDWLHRNLTAGAEKVPRGLR